MVEAAAAAAKAEAIHGNALSWETKLELWRDNAEAAHEKATGITNELELFLSTVTTINSNAGKTSIALQALLCLVKKIFTCVYDLLKQNPPAESGLLQPLKLKVDCLKELDEGEKQEIMTCIKTYEDKVKAVYDLQNEVLTKLLELLNCSDMLVAAIGSAMGLKGQLENLKARIGGTTTLTKVIQSCHMPANGEEKPIPPPCGEEILLPSRQLFTIIDSPYYTTIKDLHIKAETETDDFLEDLQIKRKLRDKALALKTSYSEAVKAAEAAETAK